MGDGLYERLVREHGYHTRIYAPVGGHKDLLAYLVRRLLENGANSSFVHQLANENLRDEDLLADPVTKVAAVGGTRHPSIPLPKDLYQPERLNSAGIDLSDRKVLKKTTAAVNKPHAFMADGYAESLGDVQVWQAIDRAQAAFPKWTARSVDERANMLEKLGNLLEKHRDELMALCVQEAYKTIPDALAEVREAVDFCRYYAARARADLQSVELPGPTGEHNMMHLDGRGVWATIAPWNFPLAIFLGQTVAALVTGNTVVAKPAPQTPRIAARAVELAHQAGIPKDVLILVSGGPEIGAAITHDTRVQGVAFTGSTGTARRIARALLAEEERALVPLIAETGGINAMIVDSTALPEQVVADRSEERRVGKEGR